MFDTHMHVYKDDDNFAEIYENSVANGVTRMLLAGTNLEDCGYYISLAKAYEGVVCGVGVHPHDADNFSSIEPYAELVQNNPDVVKAISEVGLDYFYDYADRTKQKEVFREFIQLANKFQLPVVVHCRNAEADCYEILQEIKPENGFVLHCFTGTKEWAEKFVELGAYFSVGGIITFNKAQNVRDTFEAVPDDRFFLETDSPYLAPVPFRGKRNQPAYIPAIAKFIAELRGQTQEAVAERTTEIAKRFFKL